MAKFFTRLKRKLSFKLGRSDFLLLKTEYVGSKKGDTFFIDRINHVQTKENGIKVLHHEENSENLETLSIPEDMRSDLLTKGSHYSVYSIYA